MDASHPTAAGQHLPRLVVWQVTRGCNLRCVHCRASATELASPRDLPTATCLNIIDQIASFANPILVLSGGEPLYRADIFELAQYATEKGLQVALATNGTLVTKDVAQKIVDAGVMRVSISLDGSCADTHDAFRGIPGSFDAAIYGFRNLRELGIPVQINMTIARHNAPELPKALEMVRGLGADALHTFVLVPVGCGVDIANSQVVPADEYERILNWLYDQAADGDLEVKATCSPHYARVVRLRHDAVAQPHHPNAMTEGCLAGTGICFLSFEGEIYPCGHLPAVAGNLRKQSFAEIWNNSAVLTDLRDSSKLEGKCGCCEFRNVCMGCRARAYAANGNYMAEEPFCVYEPGTLAKI
jgi:AdoMet-dependent heme synthase